MHGVMDSCSLPACMTPDCLWAAARCVAHFLKLRATKEHLSVLNLSRMTWTNLNALRLKHESLCACSGYVINEHSPACIYKCHCEMNSACFGFYYVSVCARNILIK